MPCPPPLHLGLWRSFDNVIAAKESYIVHKPIETWCSTEAYHQKEGEQDGPYCTHAGMPVKADHWSCCGQKGYYDSCPLIKPPAPPSSSPPASPSAMSPRSRKNWKKVRRALMGVRTAVRVRKRWHERISAMVDDIGNAAENAERAAIDAAKRAELAAQAAADRTEQAAKMVGQGAENLAAVVGFAFVFVGRGIDGLARSVAWFSTSSAGMTWSTVAGVAKVIHSVLASCSRILLVLSAAVVRMLAALLRAVAIVTATPAAVSARMLMYTVRRHGVRGLVRLRDLLQVAAARCGFIWRNNGARLSATMTSIVDSGHQLGQYLLSPPDPAQHALPPGLHEDSPQTGSSDGSSTHSSDSGEVAGWEVSDPVFAQIGRAHQEIATAAGIREEVERHLVTLRDGHDLPPPDRNTADLSFPSPPALLSKPSAAQLVSGSSLWGRSARRDSGARMAAGYSIQVDDSALATSFPEGPQRGLSNAGLFRRLRGKSASTQTPRRLLRRSAAAGQQRHPPHASGRDDESSDGSEKGEHRRRAAEARPQAMKSPLRVREQPGTNHPGVAETVTRSAEWLGWVVYPFGAGAPAGGQPAAPAAREQAEADRAALRLRREHQQHHQQDPYAAFQHGSAADHGHDAVQQFAGGEFTLGPSGRRHRRRLRPASAVFPSVIGKDDADPAALSERLRRVMRDGGRRKGADGLSDGDASSGSGTATMRRV